MNIFMVTSVPVTPPWDQGDKNLAYGLTQKLQHHHFNILAQHGAQYPCGENLSPVPIFASRTPSLLQKARVFWHLMQTPYSGLESNAAASCECPDLFHLVYRPTAGSSWLNRLLPAFRRRPTLHTIPALNSSQGKIYPGLFFADRLVVLSRLAYDTLRQMGFTNVTHIPVGIDTTRWSHLGRKRSRIRSRLGLSTQPVLLYPGHYTRGYGAQVILEALPGLVKKIPDLRIIFACRLRSAGDRGRERAYKKRLQDMGLSEHVRFFNTVDDMQPLIAASELTILPSETLRDKLDIPTTLLESLAARVPIIISNLPSMNELMDVAAARDSVEHRNLRVSEIGLAVPPGDSLALVEAITYMLEDPALRLRMGKNGEELVRERFNSAKTAQEYENLYQELVS
ncbi:MAG TPA: glycosyltransferase family 4 protein [Anaerolineales bacterium]|nr:glycosyltransferase family 4 protein [Anaerolineales bacterium]